MWRQNMASTFSICPRIGKRSNDAIQIENHANRFFHRRDATARQKMAAHRHAHRLRADDGLFARRPFEPRETRATSRRQKRPARREHLCEPDAVRADGRPFKISARLETRSET